MKAKAAVLEAFDQPLAIRDFEVQPLAQGEGLVRVTAAGVCGSDVHMWRGKDPRTPLPMIPGHEGVGEIADTGGEKHDLLGRRLQPGDKVMWERGVMCGRCYACVVRKEPALCPHRKTYGISFSCEPPPHLRGCYAEYLHVMAGAHFIRIDEDIEPAVLVAASCSGATAAHTLEVSRVRAGDVVLVVGPGPLGLFATAFALKAGAARVYVVGTEADKGRLEMARAFGAADTLVAGEMGPDEIRDRLLEATGGVGPNAVLDASGSTAALEANLPLVAPGGTYAIPGIAEPREHLPIDLFAHIARKNVALQGVWVSDTRHLWQAIGLVLSREFPFHKLVTHAFPLEDVMEGLEAVETCQAVKAVLQP
ncbi:MAG: zinc-binding dehydrogenase [Candidatus Brocadiia bacterium]